jgi:hypothetical protein
MVYQGIGQDIAKHNGGIADRGTCLGFRLGQPALPSCIGFRPVQQYMLSYDRSWRAMLSA